MTHTESEIKGEVIMPTGYTNRIYEGEDVSTEEFILMCARNFGALISMRDEPLDSEIPEFQPDGYYLHRLRESEIKLEEYREMTMEEAEQALEKEYQESVEQYYKDKQKCLNLEKKYLSILEEVEEWEPPTDQHNGLKEFAINQLKQSIKYDCIHNHLNKPMKEDVRDWFNKKIQSCIASINYNQQEWKDEVERASERNEWVKQLKDSLYKQG